MTTIATVRPIMTFSYVGSPNSDVTRVVSSIVVRSPAIVLISHPLAARVGR